ncbi:MAG: DUF1109 domain-containing protein [Proteobacteria bacterium]|nr:DUF1109 domain-containing protein [Pseudomonadota bacterium]
MRTDQLIRSLVADLPTPSGSVAKAIALNLSISTVISLATMLLWIGLRPEISDAMGTAPFWIKAGYTFILGTAGLFAIERLGRPGATAGSSFAVVTVVIAVLSVAATVEIFAAQAADRDQLWLGSSYSVCPWTIVVLSLPLLIAALCTLRQLAPTNYAAAGAAAGLMAGGYGACIYSLHCTEYGLPFLATWYTVGMLFVCIVGVLLSGLLRW